MITHELVRNSALAYLGAAYFSDFGPTFAEICRTFSFCYLRLVAAAEREAHCPGLNTLNCVDSV